MQNIVFFFSFEFG